MIGSIDGLHVPGGDNYSYSASKAGVHMVGRHLAAHLAARHITVNSIAPGPFQSKMMDYMLDDDASRQAVESSNPRGRIGSPEDIAGTVIFLAGRARRLHHRRGDPGRRRSLDHDLTGTI